MAAGRFGIPALAHEECLTGFTTWQATIYPTPLAWGASFDPGLVEAMAAQIGAALRSVGIHQGLAPVLDVVRDPRWGRTEETIGEDPCLVATIGTAYVRGLESAGIVATLKHFVGYSASRAGRNLAPSAIGPRELADVLLPPFELAVREGGARSVMHSYTELDGLPTAADTALLTGLLRETWGFTGTLVADYFGVSFLQLLHGVAGTPAEAATLALEAGVDVELPTVRCYGPPLLSAVRAGAIPERLIDQAATGCCDRSASSACSTRTGARARRTWTRSTSTLRTPAHWRGPSRRSPWSCSPTTESCHFAPTPASPSLARWPTMRWRRLAVTRSHGMSAVDTRDYRSEWTSRRSCSRSGRSCRRPRSSTTAAATSTASMPPGSPRQLRSRRRLTSA